MKREFFIVNRELVVPWPRWNACIVCATDNLRRNLLAPGCANISKLINFLRQHTLVQLPNQFPRYRNLQLACIYNQKQCNFLSTSGFSVNTFTMLEENFVFKSPEMLQNEELILRFLMNSFTMVKEYFEYQSFEML